MLLLALCAPWAANAQNRSIVEIGTETSVTYYPMPGFFGFQYDVYLYTPTAAPELGVDSDISSIAYNIYSISSSIGATIEIWVKDVDASYALATSTTFADYTNGATKVVDDQAFTTDATGWKTMAFSSTFSHQGGNALLVAVRGVGCSTGGGCSRQSYYTSASNMHWYRRADSIDPGTSSTGSLDGNRSNIRLDLTYTGAICFAPTNLECTVYTTTTATLGWTENGEATDWVLEYGTDNTFATGVQSVNVSTTPSTQLTGLTAETKYYARVKPDCDTDGSKWSNTCEFKPTATVSECEDFEGYSGTAYNTAGEVPEGWDVIFTGTSNNYSPHVATGIYGNNVIHQGNGFCFTSGGSSYGSNNYAILPAYEGEIASIAFRYRFENASYGTLTVGYITDISDATTYTVLETVPGSTIQSSSASYDLANRIPDGARVAFRWSYSSSYYTCGIDDVCVGVLSSSTPKPTGLTVSDITATSATLTWEAPANATPMSYLYHYKKASDSYYDQPIDNGQNLSVTLNGLDANTEYNFGVYANYADGSSDYAEITFTTEASCLPPTDITVSDITSTGAKLA